MWPFGKKKRALRELMAAKGESAGKPSKEKTRTYTKTKYGMFDEDMPQKPQKPQKPEGKAFEPPRLLTGDEVFQRPGLRGTARAYLNQDKKAMRAAAAAGRAFRKGKMS